MSDKQHQILDALGATFEAMGQNMTPAALALIATDIEDYELSDIYQALQACRRSVKGRLTAAHILEQLDAGASEVITNSSIIAQARLANTPLGILARIHIGTHDLNSTDSFYLNQRAQEVIALLPEWKKRIANEGYRAHEYAIMEKHKVNPSANFADMALTSEQKEFIEYRKDGAKLHSKYELWIGPPNEDVGDGFQPLALIEEKSNEQAE